MPHSHRLQLLGLLLWRGGVLFAVVYALFEAVRFGLRFVELPVQLEIGSGLVAVGVLFVLGSLIAERIVDSRAEGNLRDDSLD